MKKGDCTLRRRQGAFSLIELLTAITILTLLMLIFSQMITMVSQGTSQSFKRADAYGQARMILDRFGTDWDARIRRTDLVPSFSKGTGGANGSSAVVFYSQVDGFGSGTLRHISEIGYYVSGSSSTGYSLQRWANGTVWNNTASASSPLFWTVPPAINPPSFPAGNFQTLADDVCRLQFCFQRKSTGALVATVPTDFSDVGAVIAAVAVLDKMSRKQISLSQLSTLVTTLTDAPDGMTPQTQWLTNLQGASATLGPVIVQNVRIYQRTFYSN
jgi:prepilin-type N-terminal cleavage/methylation domain-containing protein